MGTGEGRKDQLAGVRLTIAHGHTGEMLIELHNLGHVGEVQFGVYPVGEEVHGHGDDVHVAGPLAVAEEGPLDPVAAGQQGQFARRHGGAAVVVGVDGHDDVFAVVQVLAHVLDLLGVHMGHGHLHGRGQVDDDLAVRAGLPHVDDFIADAQGKLHFRAGEALRGILKAEVRLRHLGSILIKGLGAGDGDVHDLVLALAENLLPLGEGGGIIQVDDDVLGPLDGLKRLFDNMRTRLGEDLDPHVVGDHVLLDDGPQELKLRLGGSGETHFDLFEPQLQQESIELQLLLQVHGGDEGLVAVPQVHAAPQGGFFDAFLLGPVQAGLRGHVVARAILVKIFHVGHDPFHLAEENAIKKPPPLKFKETKTINFSAVPLLLASSNAHSNSARSGVRRRPTPHGLAPTGRSLHGRSREAYSLHRMTVLNFSLHTG